MMRIQAFVLLAFAFSVQAATDSLRGAGDDGVLSSFNQGRKLASEPAKCKGQAEINLTGGRKVYSCESKQECLDKCFECDGDAPLVCQGAGFDGLKFCVCNGSN